MWVYGNDEVKLRMVNTTALVLHSFGKGNSENPCIVDITFSISTAEVTYNISFKNIEVILFEMITLTHFQLTPIYRISEVGIVICISLFIT